MNTYIPDMNVLWMAENAIGVLGTVPTRINRVSAVAAGLKLPGKSGLILVKAERTPVIKCDDNGDAQANANSNRIQRPKGFG